MNYKIAVALLTCLLSCGDKKKDSAKTRDDAAAGPTVAPISTPPIGVDSIKRMNFPYGDGMREWEKATPALKAKSWNALKTHADATLAKDPNHLDAHRMLATALVQNGEHAAAVDHLAAALAGDYFKYGPALANDEDLKPFFATPHGTAIKEVAEKIRGEYVKRAATGLLVIGRRSSFKWPKEGVPWATSRGELYAFDRETRRYFRLTHTDHQVAGFVRAPSGAEVAVFGFDKIDRPKGDDATPLMTRGWVQVMDTKDWKLVGTKVPLGGGREVHLGYGAGDQLLIGTAPANGRWGIGEITLSSLDKATGKVTKVKSQAPVPRIIFSLEEGRGVRALDDIKATWAGDPPTAPDLATSGGASIHVPESGAASQSSVSLSPDKARIAFATAVDPCSKDASPSLYVADAKTGALKHLLTSKSRFVTRWLDATTLAYEDGDGAVRIWDAASGREAIKLENKVGIALDVLSLAPAPLCKGAPPTVDVGSGSGDEPPPLPPEEGSAGSAIGSGDGGPVTKPN
ncbi:MAG: hypothetical protein M4D80_14775 [Myxococcota bacterium]|nr:hypothetical protein [Myxococcota bacterium]